MDAGLLKTCHLEIGHIVFDAKEKITTRRISNNWDLDVQKAVEVLKRWIDVQKDKEKLSVEYIVRGVDKQGNVFMTVVKEEKLQTVCKLYPDCIRILYSAELATDIRPMHVSLDNEYSIKNLRLEPQKRQINKGPTASAPTEPVAVKQEEKVGKKNLFATVSKPTAPTVVKEEKLSQPTTAATVKAEPQTPSSAKASPKKQSPKKDTKKVINGKGSISSFFSSKPGQTAASKVKTEEEAPIKQEPESPASSASESVASQKHSKSTPKSEPVRAEEKARKRTITDDERSDDGQDVIPNTPQEVKRDAKKRPGKPVLQRKKLANPTKKSRLMEICDSSSDDDAMDSVRDAVEEQKEQRLVDFDEDMDDATAPEQGKKPSPEKPVENDSNSVNRNRSKVKKLVTKTFTDSEGYLITVKEWEMVSEDESQENGKDKETNSTTSVPSVKAKPTPASQGKASYGEKKETPPTPKTKQGSIMSFFAKK